MSRPRKSDHSALWLAAHALYLPLACVVIQWPWLLAALPLSLVLLAGGAALFRRREMRRLSRWIDDRCQGCGYDLRGLGGSGRCPECGKVFRGLGLDGTGVRA